MTDSPSLRAEVEALKHRMKKRAALSIIARDREEGSELAKLCERILAALPQDSGRGGWRPIETAPKGQKIVAGYHNSLGNWRTILATYYPAGTLPASEDSDTDSEWAAEGWYEEGEAYSENLQLTDKIPTHWQPLPPAPGAAPQEPTPLELAEIALRVRAEDVRAMAEDIAKLTKVVRCAESCLPTVYNEFAREKLKNALAALPRRLTTRNYDAAGAAPAPSARGEGELIERAEKRIAELEKLSASALRQLPPLVREASLAAYGAEITLIRDLVSALTSEPTETGDGR